jgi:hypothetical protein
MVREWLFILFLHLYKSVCCMCVADGVHCIGTAKRDGRTEELLFPTLNTHKYWPNHLSPGQHTSFTYRAGHYIKGSVQ